MVRPKIKSRSHHDAANLQHQPMSLPSFNFLPLMVSEVKPGQNFKGQDHYRKVESMSHYNVAQLHPPANVPTKFELPTPYGF